MDAHLMLAVPLGLAIGLSLGALGGGGSVLTVPALVYLLGQDPRTATTSSLLIVGSTSLLSLVPHRRAGRVRLGQGLAFGALGTAGSLAGTGAAGHVRPEVLLSAFAVLMLLVAALMVRRSLGGQSLVGEAPTEPLLTLHPLRCSCPRLAKLVVTATAVGVLTGFFGVGGGFAVVPALVLALGFPMPVAVGTSLVVIAVNSATALGARISAGVGQIDWLLIAVFTGAAALGSLAGGRLTTRVPPVVLTRVFAGLLTVVALYTAARSLPGLR